MLLACMLKVTLTHQSNCSQQSSRTAQDALFSTHTASMCCLGLCNLHMVSVLHLVTRTCTELPLHVCCSALANGVSKYKYAKRITDILQQILSESGGSFRKLEPSMQAVVQTAATTVIQCPDVRTSSSLVMGLLPMVPLLTSRSYSRVLDQLLTGVGMYPVQAKAWLEQHKQRIIPDTSTHVVVPWMQCNANSQQE